MKLETIGIVGQWLSILIVTFGIGIEIGYGAHWGFVFVTAGGVILAVATKVKYYRG